MFYKKFTKDTGLIGLVNIATALKRLILLPVITKCLGAESYGIWVQLIVTLSLVAPIATLGLPFTLVRFLAAEKKQKEIQNDVWSVMVIVLAVTSMISLVLLFFSNGIAQFWGTERVIIQVLAGIILVECLNLTFFNFFRAFQLINKYSFFMIFQTLGEAALVAIAVFSGFDIVVATMSLLAIRFATFLMMATLIIKKIGVCLPTFSRTKEYLHFSIPAIPGMISAWAIQSSDKYLIGYFLGTLFVGYYAPAYTIGTAIMLFAFPLIQALSAVLSKAFDNNQIHEVKTYLSYSLKYFLMLAIPSVFGLTVLSKQLLTIFSTVEIANQSYLIVPVVALSSLLFGTYSIITQIIVLKKNTKILGNTWLAAAALNLGLNAIFIPVIGIIGAAITTFTAHTFAFVLLGHYSFSYFRFNLNWLFILKSVCASIIMVLLIAWIAPNGLLQTCTSAFSGFSVYWIMLFVLKGFDKREFVFFKGLIGMNS